MRYDFATLARVMGMSEPEAVTALSIDAKSAILYRRDGMSELVADRVAVRAGFVPYDVWPDWFQDASRPCDDCGRAFVAKRKDGRFCSPPCYRRWWAREVARARRARPELAERNRQRRRAYYAENAEYEKARERRRYTKNKDNVRHKIDGGIVVDTAVPGLVDSGSVAAGVLSLMDNGAMEKVA